MVMSKEQGIMFITSQSTSSSKPLWYKVCFGLYKPPCLMQKVNEELRRV